MSRCPGLAVLALTLITAALQAHYHMLLPSKHSVKKGEEVTITCQFGHPFEHELFDMDVPTSLVVQAPDGIKTTMTKSLKKVSVAGPKGKKVTAYAVKFTPKERGDYTIVLRSAPVYLDEDKIYVEDTVKVILHVQAQKSWDATTEGFELIPWTRPYGLVAGDVYQALASPDHNQARGQPWHRLMGQAVEVERYNAKPPESLPADEFITRRLKIDPRGMITTTLPDPGWWSITAYDRGTKTIKIKGKDQKVARRATLWVYVDAKPKK